MITDASCSRVVGPNIGGGESRDAQDHSEDIVLGDFRPPCSSESLRNDRLDVAGSSPEGSPKGADHLLLLNTVLSRTMRGGSVLAEAWY